MSDFAWRLAFESSDLDQTDIEERAFKAGWQALLAQIIAAFQDEHRQNEVEP